MEYEVDKFLCIVNELTKAIKEGFLCIDEQNKNNILVYRKESKYEPEGWYSENILSVARDLYHDDDSYNEFKNALKNAKKE